MAKLLVEWLQALGAIPRPVWAVLAGLAAGILVAQWLKFQVPELVPAKLRARAARIIAFGAAFAFTTLVWGIRTGEDGAQVYQLNLDGVVAAAIVGLAAPFVYWLGVRAVGLKWPKLRERWSQDVRP